MSRTMVIAALVTALSVVAPAHAQPGKSVLSSADRQRRVCVPQRERDGRVAVGKVCMTGREWEIALAKVPQSDGAASSAAYLAQPSAFRLNAYAPWGVR